MRIISLCQCTSIFRSSPLWKRIQLEKVRAKSMEPNDVDCNANNVHAQAQFHLQAKANIHIQSQSSTDAATKASRRGVPSKKKYIPSPMCSCLMLSRQWHWEGWPQGAWMHKNTRAWQDTTNTQGAQHFYVELSHYRLLVVYFVRIIALNTIN